MLISDEFCKQKCNNYEKWTLPLWFTSITLYNEFISSIGRSCLITLSINRAFLKLNIVNLFFNENRHTYSIIWVTVIWYSLLSFWTISFGFRVSKGIFVFKRLIWICSPWFWLPWFWLFWMVLDSLMFGGGIFTFYCTLVNGVCWPNWVCWLNWAGWPNWLWWLWNISWNIGGLRLKSWEWLIRRLMKEVML